MHGAELISGLIGAFLAYRADHMMITAELESFPWISVLAPVALTVLIRALA